MAERRALLESSFSETLVLRSDIGTLLGESESHPLNWRDIYSYILAHSRDVVNQSIPTDEYRLGSILASNRSNWTTGQILAVDGGIALPVLLSMQPAVQQVFGDEMVEKFGVREYRSVPA